MDRRRASHEHHADKTRRVRTDHAMRTLLLLFVAVAIGTACSDDSEPETASPAGPAWLAQPPENAYPYADETLARFRKLVEGDGWRDPAWNVCGRVVSASLS